MMPRYTENEFNLAKSETKLPCQCEHCKNIFHTKKKYIKHELQYNKNEVRFCSSKCSRHYYQGEKKLVTCKQCNLEFLKDPAKIKKYPNHFCSQSCAASYNNTHKTIGNRRSKLEQWLEEQLTSLYPSLDIHFNRKDAINSELDIYIPSFNLAFELNGIFHYEPIYGIDKLNKTKSNDISKSKACHDAKIDLCVIDTTHQKKFKESNSKIYLDIITNIINGRTLTS